MPRNMSFMLTTRQIRDRTKTVTRRMGWRFLTAGELIQACEKCQGIPKGGAVNKLCVLRVMMVRREILGRMIDFPPYGQEECRLEGFPDYTPQQFVDMFCAANPTAKVDESVTRIEFEYLDGEP